MLVQVHFDWRSWLRTRKACRYCRVLAAVTKTLALEKVAFCWSTRLHLCCRDLQKSPKKILFSHISMWHEPCCYKTLRSSSQWVVLKKKKIIEGSLQWQSISDIIRLRECSYERGKRAVWHENGSGLGEKDRFRLRGDQLYKAFFHLGRNCDWLLLPFAESRLSTT